jgi:hypothetical protein
MKRSVSLTAAAGLGLIAAVNAWILIGVAYNRSGEPESSLRLTERELSAPHQWAFQKENSGLSLKLLWRVRDEDNEARGYYYAFGGVGGRATWLNESKLKELGIEVSPTSLTEAQKRRYAKLGSKEVFLVLEFDGPTYRALLERTREHARAPKGEGSQGSQAAEVQAKLLGHEELHSSRLFVIDAGLDVSALRRKYPDRTRYAIVQGRIYPPPVVGYGKGNLGLVEALAVDSVNVPLEFRPVLVGAASRGFYPMVESPAGPQFEVAVAFGKRLEPWLTGATRKP